MEIKVKRKEETYATLLWEHSGLPKAWIHQYTAIHYVSKEEIDRARKNDPTFQCYYMILPKGSEISPKGFFRVTGEWGEQLALLHPVINYMN